jgi:hypothetical protein
VFKQCGQYSGSAYERGRYFVKLTLEDRMDYNEVREEPGITAMKCLICAAIVIACTSSVRAQIVASSNRTPGGLPEVRIRNGAPVSLTAFAVGMNPRTREPEDRAPFLAFFDTLIDATTPLEPNHERTVPVLLRLRPGRGIEELFEPPIITAGILADGTTAGDPVLLTRLMLRRSNMLLALETALETLSDAGRRNVPRDQLTQQFRKMADSMWRWYVPPEQQVGRSLFISIIEKLRAVPAGPVGSPFPPSTFVADETAALNKQRVALLESQPSLANARLIRAP